MKFILPLNSSSLDNTTPLHSLFSIPLPWCYTLAVIYTLLILLGLLGNCAILHVLPRPGVLEKKKVQNVLMMSLAGVDVVLLVVLGVITSGVLLVDAWCWGGVVCHVTALFSHVVVYEKLFVILLMTLHRAFVLCYPFRAGYMFTNWRAVKTVALSCILSLLLGGIALAGSQATLFQPPSCIPQIYLRDTLAWAGWLLLSVVGITISSILVALAVACFLARGIRVRRLAWPSGYQRPEQSHLIRFLKWLRRNKSTSSTIMVVILFLL